MGEALDYVVGQAFIVDYGVPDEPSRLRFKGEISYVWETHVDVIDNRQIFRFPRRAISDAGLLPFAWVASADEVIDLGDYDPEDEAASQP